jgi:hypothetical protein
MDFLKKIESFVSMLNDPTKQKVILGNVNDSWPLIFAELNLESVPVHPSIVCTSISIEFLSRILQVQKIDWTNFKDACFDGIDYKEREILEKWYEHAQILFKYMNSKNKLLFGLKVLERNEGLGKVYVNGTGKTSGTARRLCILRDVGKLPLKKRKNQSLSNCSDSFFDSSVIAEVSAKKKTKKDPESHPGTLSFLWDSSSSTFPSTRNTNEHAYFGDQQLLPHQLLLLICCM